MASILNIINHYIYSIDAIYAISKYVSINLGGNVHDEKTNRLYSSEN